jgi:hypothetical protein
MLPIAAKTYGAAVLRNMLLGFFPEHGGGEKP